jgi:hypothetical protein
MRGLREVAFSWLFGIAIAIAVLFAACSERPPTRFPHQLHLTELDCGVSGKPACLSCNTCHTPSAIDRVHKLPESALCIDCHEKDLHRMAAVVAVKPERQSGEITFAHEPHLKMAGIDGQCVPCHAGVLEPGRPNIPPMSQCFSCHEHEREWKAAVCSPCHADKDLRRTLPRTFLRHDQSFARNHGQLAAEQGQLCESCHAQADCDECHDLSKELGIERQNPELIERNFVHRGDFVTRHAIEAESQPAKCARCHTPETCDACHAARGVSGALSNGRSPHPPGWIGSNTNTRSFHGIEARRSILECAGCHDQGPATNCIRCHKVGAYGGNPHPGGSFTSSRSPNQEMCRYCHE